VYKNYDRGQDPQGHRRARTERAEVEGRSVRHRAATREVSLTDDYFIDKKLLPNVDFYSGLIYRAMGFSDRHVPVLSDRTLPGWIAHWWEGNENSKTKIARPRQIYSRARTERKYVPIDQRT